jgi:predicted NAD/FAD-dependent oxidoreductase
MPGARIAIIGAGVAGLGAARTLVAAGDEVVVFDKGRGPGGRASTRRVAFGRFDHGAQFFTVRSERFARVVDGWARAGVAAPWVGEFVTQRDGRREPDEERARWVGVPGMNEIVRDLADGLDVRFGTRVDSIARVAERWILLGEAGQDLDAFDGVVVAVPSVQAAALVEPVAPALARRAERAEMQPCWTVMVAFRAPVGAGFAGLRMQDEGPLGWAGCDSSKPGRDADGHERWVLQASPTWSRDHLEQSPEWVAHELLAALSALTGKVLPPLIGAEAHRWRYALASDPVGERCLFDAAERVGVCGDWLIGARIEAAYLSGVAAGEAMLHAD